MFNISERYQANNEFDCPECRQPVVIPPEGLPKYRDGMALNEDLDQLYENINLAGSDSSIPQDDNLTPETICLQANQQQLGMHSMR